MALNRVTGDPTANEQGNGGYDPGDSSNANTAQGGQASNNPK